MNERHDPAQMYSTTIVTVRKGGRVVIAGDGQVSLGNTVMKGNARKVRRIGKDAKVIAGFAGATADAFTLLERLEAKLEQYPERSRKAGSRRRSRRSPAGRCASRRRSASTPTTTSSWKASTPGAEAPAAARSRTRRGRHTLA